MTNAQAQGYLAVFSAVATYAGTSNINYFAGRTIANNATSAVDSSAKINVRFGGGTTDFVIDVLASIQRHGRDRTSRANVDGRRPTSVEPGRHRGMGERDGQVPGDRSEGVEGWYCHPTFCAVLTKPQEVGPIADTSTGSWP